jgi:4-hydroxy-3-polyprenylbenzoate decarboxylase
MKGEALKGDNHELKPTSAHLILGVTGASGIYAARLLVEKSPWPVDLVASRWGRAVAGTECGGIEDGIAGQVFSARRSVCPLSSGSVPAVGMVVLPCSAHTLAQIAAGLGDSLIHPGGPLPAQGAKPLILCLREAPLTLIDLDNARRASAAGAVIMPMSPPFFMFAGPIRKRCPWMTCWMPSSIGCWPCWANPPAPGRISVEFRRSARISGPSGTNGELARIRVPVDPNQEMTIIQHRVMAAGGPALLFENVVGSNLTVWSAICSAPGSARTWPSAVIRLCWESGSSGFPEP